jgi:hypothetical protein
MIFLFFEIGVAVQQQTLKKLDQGRSQTITHEVKYGLLPSKKHPKELLRNLLIVEKGDLERSGELIWQSESTRKQETQRIAKARRSGKPKVSADQLDSSQIRILDQPFLINPCYPCSSVVRSSKLG